MEDAREGTLKKLEALLKKMTDSRAEKYTQSCGESSWELDALNPVELARMVEDTITGLVDTNKWYIAVEKSLRIKKNLGILRSIWNNFMPNIKTFSMACITAYLENPIPFGQDFIHQPLHIIEYREKWRALGIAKNYFRNIHPCKHCQIKLGII